MTITVHDLNDNPVSGATVNGIWSAGVSGSGTCITDGNGGCSITKTNIKGNVSSVSFTVDTVSQVSMVYQASQNHDPDGDSDGTSITLPKP